MKISFEFWLNEKNLSANTKELFNEAIICYKAGANRAALLFSYIAFIELIKNRLLEANKPDEVTQGEWDNKRKKLLDDFEVDKEIFDILNRTDNKYFKLNDSLRNQIKYWKDRRNDCAHLKLNKIDSAHVETFWNFIMSNINRFSIVGSQNDFINRILRHYDEDSTPIGSDFSSIVLDIPQSVDLSNFSAFLLELEEILLKVEEEQWLYYTYEYAGFFYSMLTKLEESYSEIVKNFVLSNSKISTELFGYKPEFLIYFKNENAEYIRQLWKKSDSVTAKQACVLLRNTIVPANQIDELIEDCIYKNKNHIPKVEELEFLIPYGYVKRLNYIIEKALSEGKAFEWWLKDNNKFMKFYIKYNFTIKKSDIIDMFLKNVTYIPEGEQTRVLFSLFSGIIRENDEFLAYTKQRAVSLGVDLDKLLMIF